MISLDDSEMQILIEAARPIPQHDRAAFLADVAAELARYPELGPGIIGRVVREIQRRHLNAPDLRGVGSKYGH